MSTNLCVCPNVWGDANDENVKAVIHSCIEIEYSWFCQEQMPNKDLIVTQSPNEFPWICKQQDKNIIFLHTRDRYWSQYAYQFSHELCHHVIDAEYCEKARFGWFEESICELASLCCLSQMADKWEITPPYLNWQSYASALREYANEIIQKPSNNVDDFNIWLSSNLDALYLDRYNRHLNSIIAVHLFPTFNENHQMWKVMQYLNKIEISVDMTLNEYLNNLSTIVPLELELEMNRLKELLGC